MWALVGSGCSGEGALPAEDFPSAFVRVACQRTQECCGPDGAVTPLQERKLTCEVNREFVAALMGNLGQAIADHRAAYDAVLAARCLAAIQSIGCAARLDLTRAEAASSDCAGVIRGLLGAGAACLSGWDCGPGLFCERVEPASQRCSSRKPDGAACAGDDQCAGGNCRDKRCQGPPPMCGVF